MSLVPPSYCPFCTDSGPVQVQDDTDAFSLSNLLAAGTITVTVHDGSSPCLNASNGRDWHSLPAREPSARQEDTLFQQLVFLSHHLFLRATCKLGVDGCMVFIRIYLIPNDLPNVSGRLHHRTKTVVKEAQRCMHNIVPLIEQHASLWHADEALNTPPKRFLPSHIDNRTMAEIYSDLPSPMLPRMNEFTRLSYHIASGGEIWGLRSTLYGYQRRSVAVMIDRESTTSPVLDPLYVSVSCMSDTRWYIQPSTMSVLRECPTFLPSRSGILCEELGTGKTIIVIALALATVKQLPDPEESPVDDRPVLTPLAYNHFPSVEYALARDRAGMIQIIQQVPSLVEVLVHYLASMKAATGLSGFTGQLEACHLWPIIQANAPFYHHYDAELETSKSRRNPPSLSPRTMYLSSATLVIVPQNLLGQWKSEIDKHCYDCVRYLVVRPPVELPRARELASNYELIIMDSARFRKELEKNKAEKLHSITPCTCPYLLNSRVPDCRCSGNPEVTPLLQIRWKRLVVDEGHNTGNTSATNHFIQKLSIESKWVVTGTPTSNILGLQLGYSIGEYEVNQDEDSIPSHSCPNSPEPVFSSQDDEFQQRIWSSYDCLNLRKLGTILGNFLSVPRFRSDLKCFTEHVSAPLCDQNGPRPGAIDVLTQVMKMVMVRHRIEDVENDVVLPPMKHDIVFVDLDEYALKSYNAMQAALMVNAIDSEREGSDYLFHPNQAKALQVAIGNSSQGLFWSSSDILYNVDEIRSHADTYITTAISREKSSEELNLLQQALGHAIIAAKDATWRSMQPFPDVPFKIFGLDPAIFEAWTRTGLRNSNRTIDVMHPDRLVELRALVRKRPTITLNDLIRKGNSHESKEQRSMDSNAFHPREAKRGKKWKETAKEVQRAVDDPKQQMEVSDEELEKEDFQIQDKGNHITSAETSLMKSSLLSGVKVGPSLSTKLNYILSEVQRYSAREKFLLFSDSLLTLSQIGEALTLFEIKYLRYTNEEKHLLREQCIMTFETSDVYRVLLVSLKLGARGLNLISASRVIFCEPVWYPDVESQAIKRVHRIGQTRPVTGWHFRLRELFLLLKGPSVKTLAVRSTAEEAMIARRQYMRTNEKIPNMITESGMREYLQNPSFLMESTPSNLIDLVLSLDVYQTQLSGVQPEDGTNRVDVDIESHIRPRKRVRLGE